MARTMEVTEGDITMIGDERVNDPDQAERFDEFRQSAETDRTGMIVSVMLVPTAKDGTYNTKGPMEQLFSAPIDQYSREQILDKIRTEYMDLTDKRWLIRIQIRQLRARGLKHNELAIVRRGLNDAPSGEKRTDIGDILGNVAKMIADSQARTDAMFTRMIERQQTAPQVPQRDPIDLILAMNQQAQQQAGLQMQNMVALITAMQPASQGGSNLMTMIQTMRELKGLAGDLSGAEPESETAGIIKAVAPMAVPFLQYMATQKGAAPGNPASGVPALPAPVKPAIAPPVTPLPAKPAAVPSEEAMLLQLREQLGALADIAASNPDPALVASQVIDTMPEAMDEQLYTTLAADNWFEKLSAIQSKLTPHREWLTKVRDAMLASFEDEKPAE